MKASDETIWCDQCKYKIFKSPVTEGELHFCDDICRDVYQDEGTD